MIAHNEDKVNGSSGAARISVQGEHFRGRHRKGSRGGGPEGQKIFKISKKVLKKIAKMDYVRRFFKKIKKSRD